MGLRSLLFDRPEALEPLAAAWDAMPARRGTQADFYDSYAWLRSWCEAVGPDAAAAVRVPAVLDGDKPIALLPLIARGSKKWQWPGQGFRLRYRPVINRPEPVEPVIGMLVEELAAAGARELTLSNLPSRDPCVGALIGALHKTGYLVAHREGSSECLAQVERDWGTHRKRFGRYDRTVRSKANKIKGLGSVAVRAYRAGGAPIADGFEIYADLHAKSWKGTLTGRTRTLRRELLTRADALGWSRVFILEIGGIPAAAHVWFRVGEVATWLSTAYDQRLAVISPGTILMWKAQEEIFRESTPQIVDFLPGRNPQKDQLGPDRAPLLSLDAARKTVVSMTTFPVRCRMKRALRGARRLLPKRAARPSATPPRKHRIRTLTVGPDPNPLATAPLELDSVTKRYLAVAGGHAGTDEMLSQWDAEDSWWRIGEGPDALVRLGSDRTAPRVVREIILLADRGEPSIESLLASLASTTGRHVAADLPSNGDGREGSPIPIHRAALPWPR